MIRVLIVVLALTCYLEMFENYLAALLRPRIPTFFRDVFGRLTALALILLYHFRLISLEDLLQAKQASGRAKDFDDIRHLNKE